MADENEAIADPELETPAIETENGPDDTEIETEGEEADGDDDGGDQGDDVDGESDVVTLEVNGVEYEVPKALEAAFLKNKDYTEKTQVVAQKSRELDDRAALIEQQAAATDEELDLRASLKTMDKTLAEYAKLTKEDWAAHRAADYIGTEDAWREYQDLKAERDNTAKALEGKQGERTEAAQQDLAKRVQETLAAAETVLPGLKPAERTAKIGSLIEFATSTLKIPEQVLKSNWSPVLLEVLNLANIGKLTMAKKATPPKKDPIAPLTTVKAKSNPKPSGLDDRLSNAEWQKRREAQVRARG